MLNFSVPDSLFRLVSLIVTPIYYGKVKCVLKGRQWYLSPYHAVAKAIILWIWGYTIELVKILYFLV